MLSTVQMNQLRLVLSGMMGHTVSVETFAGDTGVGPTYADAASVTCNADTGRKLVRDREGNEVISELTLHVPYSDEAKFTPESKVTYSSRISRVIIASTKTYKGTVAYVEVSCT